VIRETNTQTIYITPKSTMFLWFIRPWRLHGVGHIGDILHSKVNAKCDVVMKLSLFGTRTGQTHTHTRQNL